MICHNCFWRRMGEDRIVTTWMSVGLWLGVAIYAAAWFRGGHVERFAAAVMLVVCVLITLNFLRTVDGTHNYLPGRIADYGRLLLFGWLCLRSDRWWPFLMTAAFGLIAVVDVVGWLDPAISQWGVASAKLGLGYLADLSLLLGVWERRLAGEEPAGRAAWARADTATSARQNGSGQARRSVAGRSGEPAEVFP